MQGTTDLLQAFSGYTDVYTTSPLFSKTSPMDRFDVAQGTAVGDCVWVEFYGGLGLVRDVGTWASESSPSFASNFFNSVVNAFMVSSILCMSGLWEVE